MLFLVEFIAFIIIWVIWWYKNDISRYSKYPPGPVRFPFIGSLFQLLKHSHPNPGVTFERLAKIYGDVMFIKVGGNESVVVSSLETLNEMLTNENATGRYQYELVKDRHDNRNLGLLWSYGKPWQALRRFTLRNLRDFGFGKSGTMDKVINEEIEKFFVYLKEQVNQSKEAMLHVEDPFSLSVVNVLWRLVSAQSYDLDDPKMLRWVYLNNEWLKTIKVGMDISDPFPWLRDWFPNWTGRTAQKKMYKELYDYGKKLLDSHKVEESLLENSVPQTFVDVFVKKIEESKEIPDTPFNDDQFILSILDLFVAGSESSSNTLSFAILYMILNPTVQEKVQQEIDTQVPNGMPIDSSMKPMLPYTCATVLEIFRYSTLVPMPIAREAVRDFDFRGYHIRKGTTLMFNVYAVHFSEKLWGDPFTFRPERFLNSEGTAIDQTVSERLKAFGAGQRICLGQSLADTTVFLYFASTLRKFKFVKVPGTNPTTDPMVGLTCAPRPFDVHVMERTEE